jgi:hypothetical protein
MKIAYHSLFPASIALISFFSFFNNELSAQSFQLAENGVTISCEGVENGTTATSNNIEYVAVDEQALRDSVRTQADLTKVCTSNVTDMSAMFQGYFLLNSQIEN